MPTAEAARTHHAISNTARTPSVTRAKRVRPCGCAMQAISIHAGSAPSATTGQNRGATVEVRIASR